jgi:hypothetical protein
MKKIFRANEFTAEFNDDRDYFSLTGYVSGVSGAVGDKIASLNKKFLAIEKMHLSNSKTGEPMHAEANALYHAEKMDKEALIKSLRCTNEQADKLVDLVFRINGSRKRLDEIEPYRRHKCTLSKKELIHLKHESGEGLTIYDAEQQDYRHKKCSHEWLAKVEFAAQTPNLSGEVTAYCPKCKKRAEWSSKWLHPNGKTYSFYHSLENVSEELQNLYKIHSSAKKEWGEIFKGLKLQWLAEAKETYAIVKSIPSDLRTEDESIDLDDFLEPERVQALAEFLDCPLSIITESAYGGHVFSAEGSDWLVVDDNEADELWEEDLENYVEECILPDLNEMHRNYFDTESWIEDTKRNGDRGNSLNRYSGEEDSVEFEGITWFIYQQ